VNALAERKPLTWIFNPFVYVAGGKALLLGLGAIVVAGLIGAAGHTHFDGVLDVHSGALAPLWCFVAEGFLDWLCLAVVLLILGKVASRTSFRAIDVLGTQALARWPTVLIALATLPPGFVRFSRFLVDLLLKPGSKAELNVADAVMFCVAVFAIIVLICWFVVLMYNAYSVSCNLRGGKAIGTFIGGLLLAEILSKVAVMGLLSWGGAVSASSADTAAVSAARSWLSLLDEGSYSRSWQQSAPLFQAKITEKSWQQIAETVRKPLGGTLSRQLKSAQPATQLPGAPDGKYLVLQFNTSFAAKAAAVETVTVGQEKDGAWRVSGYFIK
jgi:hypothetical protein